MTIKKELDWLYRLRSEIYVYMPKEWLIPMRNALDMAIQALEQEPCEETNQYKKGYVDCTRDVIDKINLNYSKHQLIDVQSLKDIIITTRSTIEVIDNVPIDNAVVIPKDATNGDVIKAAFGEPAKISESGVLYKIADFVSYIGYEWWNEPYKAESEGIRNDKGNSIALY